MGILRKIKDFRNTDKNNIQLIKKSDLFDEEYYLNENPNIKMSAAKHYYYYGFREGKSPSYKFSNNYYLDTYKDVNDSGMNPLVHYLRYGKMENRKIKKDNGISIEELYYKFYNYSVSLNVYFTGQKMNRVNLFFDSIDENVIKYKNIIEYTIKYCNENNYTLRIIYGNSNLEHLNNLFCDNQIEIPKNIEYLYLKKNNYLFVGNNEKYICTSYKCVYALLNTKLLKTNIYYYLLDEGNILEDKYYISKVCHNPNVICLSDKKISLYKYLFEFKTVGKINVKNIFYLANDLFMIGIMWLNRGICENVINGCKLNVVYSKKLNFHFENDIEMRCMSKFFTLDDDVIFKLCSDDIDNVNVVGMLKKQNGEVKINKLKNFDVLNQEFNYVEYEDEEYKKFIKIFEKNGD